MKAHNFILKEKILQKPNMNRYPFIKSKTAIANRSGDMCQRYIGKTSPIIKIHPVGIWKIPVTGSKLQIRQKAQHSIDSAVWLYEKKGTLN